MIGCEFDSETHQKNNRKSIVKIPEEVKNSVTNKEGEKEIRSNEKLRNESSENLTYFILSKDDLPTCNQDKLHYLFYIFNEKVFFNCDGKSWIQVEVVGTKGEKGEPGTTGPAGNNAITENNFIMKTIIGGSVSSISCNNSSISNSKITYEYYTMESEGLGNPYKTCISESCVTSIMNGSHIYYKNSGTEGCINSISDYISCSYGYKLEGNNCVPVCSTFNLDLCQSKDTCESIGRYWWNNTCHATCQDDKIITTRGCESPIATCTEFQGISDNRCVDIGFTKITGNICGNYTYPIHFEEGNYIITCNSIFTEKVVISPGAIFKVDNNWKVSFKDIHAVGTSEKEIHFHSSDGNPVGYWNGFEINGGYVDFKPTDGYISGNRLEYIEIDGLGDRSGDEIILNNVFAKYLVIDELVDLRYLNVYLESSQINVKQLNSSSSSKKSFMISNTISGNVTIYDSFAAWNTFNYGTMILGSLHHHTAMLYNTFHGGSRSCFNSNNMQTLVHGNYQVTGTSSGTGCSVIDNSSNDISSKLGVYIINKDLNLKIGESAEISALILNRNGWLNETNIIWKANYDVDGVYYDYSETWNGKSPIVSFNHSDYFELKVESIQFDSDLIGRTSMFLYID